MTGRSANSVYRRRLHGCISLAATGCRSLINVTLCYVVVSHLALAMSAFCIAIFAAWLASIKALSTRSRSFFVLRANIPELDLSVGITAISSLSRYLPAQTFRDYYEFNTSVFSLADFHWQQYSRSNVGLCGPMQRTLRIYFVTLNGLKALKETAGLPR